MILGFEAKFETIGEKGYSTWEARKNQGDDEDITIDLLHVYLNSDLKFNFVSLFTNAKPVQLYLYKI